MRSLSILIVIASLALVLVATLALGSLAVFTDQATVAGNTFTTGAFPTATPTPAPISLGAVADTYVKEDKGGDDNFGTDADMQVTANSSKVKRSLVAFDVSSIPSGSEITSATLTVCLSANPPSGSQGRTEELRLVTSSWTETVVVWNTQPTVSGTVTGTITVPTTAQCLTFTVTADVQAWVAGVANNGWRISDQDEATNSGDVNYRSRENGTTNERPKLEVNYQSCSDTTAPGAPNGLVASAGELETTLNWNDNGESDLAGYNIYRSTTAGGPYSKLNSSLLTSSAYTDTGVANGVTYYYVVTAVDDCANESANSNEESAAYSVFGAVADTYVKEEKGGDDNFGADAELTVKADSGKVKRALVSFDVSSIPSGSVVSSATLTVCLSANPGSTRTHELRRITSSWVETVVVWNDQPTASGTVTDTITVPTTAQCLTFTVTADVQAWVDGTANNGWRISDQDETTDSGDVNYRSRENGTTNERPKLEVVYAPP